MATTATLVYQRPESFTQTPTHYCPGCTHGTAHRLVAEVLDEMGLRGKSIGVAPVGCSVFAYNYIDTDWVEAAHGRAPAMATGIKRVLPNQTVFTYQGDGDMASIGMGEIMHVAGRGENITTIFVNNAIYGMTGGQMAPTTMPGQVTSTSPYGRNVEEAGWPMRICELLSTLRTPGYIERVAVHTPQNIVRTKKAIRTAFQNQIDRRCFSLIEVLSTCPTNWGLTPCEATNWVQTNMSPYYPLGVFKKPEPRIEV